MIAKYENKASPVKRKSMWGDGSRRGHRVGRRAVCVRDRFSMSPASLLTLTPPPTTASIPETDPAPTPAPTTTPAPTAIPEATLAPTTIPVPTPAPTTALAPTPAPTTTPSSTPDPTVTVKSEKVDSAPPMRTRGMTQKDHLFES